MEFTDRDKYAIGSFLSLAFYNDYEKDVKDIIEVLKVANKLIGEENKYKAISRPRHWSKETNSKIDDFGGIFWSWLVLQYGDYGTSPRFGWLYPEAARIVLKTIQDIYEEE